MAEKLSIDGVLPKENVLASMPKGIVSALTTWSKQEIDSLYNRAQIVVSYPELLIKRAPASLSYGRILVVIPKKVGTAPERNLVRRRIKAIVYENQLYTRGFDWVFISRPLIKKLSFQDLTTLIINACTAA